MQSNYHAFLHERVISEVHHVKFVKKRLHCKCAKCRIQLRKQELHNKVIMFEFLPIVEFNFNTHLKQPFTERTNYSCFLWKKKSQKTAECLL